eukprot:gnl/MRDRNA2_/MRDRNA2_95630_c0_seq1.p1 gnl/MRDRNA2_/MRDRNA2_95630_c0~~gnl/MRDRNA2_/MRDRNA2_95630_c0_seq1.p1  ORF type:complete len:331 (-),score=62.39 gnl/MRDRNA2_/MRDRNA2_95630_c0_seq1:18-953(-)
MTLEDFLQKTPLEEFSTASTIPGSEEDGSTCNLQPEDELEDGEILEPTNSMSMVGLSEPTNSVSTYGFNEPTNSVEKVGLSQLELDELCVDDSDVEHRSISSAEEGEITEDEAGMESEIDFELQLQDSHELCKGMDWAQKDKSNIDLMEGSSWSPDGKISAAKTPGLASSSPYRNGLEPLNLSSPRRRSSCDLQSAWQDRRGLEPLCLSPRGKPHPGRSYPMLTSLHRQTSMVPCSVLGKLSSCSLFDAVSQEQLTNSFLALLSSDSEAVESATVNFLAQLADVVGPHVDPTVKKMMHINCLKQQEGSRPC